MQMDKEERREAVEAYRSLINDSLERYIKAVERYMEQKEKEERIQALIDEADRKEDIETHNNETSKLIETWTSTRCYADQEFVAGERYEALITFSPREIKDGEYLSAYEVKKALAIKEGN